MFARSTSNKPPWGFILRRHNSWEFELGLQNPRHQIILYSSVVPMYFRLGGLPGLVHGKIGNTWCKTKDLTQWKFMMTSRTRYFEVEITREYWWNIVWCFYLWQCFLAINWLWNWFTVGWTCSDLSFCWTVVILKLSQKHEGPSRSLHVVLNENPMLLKECVNGELSQPKIYSNTEQKESSSKSLLSCLYCYSGSIQTLSKITVRISLGFSKS